MRSAPGIPVAYDGGAWFDLRTRLERWLRPRTRPPIDAADVASEVVLRGVVAHGPEPTLPPPRLWCWSCTAARNVIVDLQRRSRRRRLSLRADLEDLAPVLPSGRQASAATLLLVAELDRRANPTQRAMLGLLRQGDPSNREMAQVLGISVRAIERNRQQLRCLAERIGATVALRWPLARLPDPES